MNKNIGRTLAGVAILLAGAGIAILSIKKKADISGIDEPDNDLEEE